MGESNGKITLNGKKWWILGPLIAVGGMIFGAGGATYTARDSIARQGRAIEDLSGRVAISEIAQARIDERLKSIDTQLREIKELLRGRAARDASGNP